MRTSMMLAWLGLCLLPQMLQAEEDGMPMTTGDGLRVVERPVSPMGGVSEHPILPTLRWAYDGVKHMESIQDYSATFVKRERIDGELQPHQYMSIKIRHKPFSVYIKFLAPESLKGQEAIYVEGKYDNKLMAHGTGLKAIVGTLALHPTSALAMQGTRYPITDAGIVNLTKKLIEVGENDSQFGEIEVKTFKNAKVNDRPTTCMQFMHPVPRKEFRYHIARIFVDNELNLPVRYESYDWPEEEGQKPPLLEEVTYLNLKINNGFTDLDFDIKNPAYDYRK